MAIRKKNRNIVLLKSVKDLKDEICYEAFEYKKHFVHLCNLIPNKELERLEIQELEKQNIKREGLVYIFVIKGYIFKIGHTIGSIKARVQSYNCGKTEYRISGTNSTTNYFVLQSLLNIGEIVNVYAFFPPQPKYELFGLKYQDSFPVSKRAENIILNDFIKNHNKKPIGCTQR
ncbi:MAG: GIY-YIG nuclease family protein [Elusimicrobiota bacterium]|jgi:hypothetical protein|nr:GIY-YIG nuclease family protein [Elusimicrobiota bacterium]